MFSLVCYIYSNGEDVSMIERNAVKLPVAQAMAQSEAPQLRQTSSVSGAPVLFGNKTIGYEPDRYDPNPEKTASEVILNFVEPKPKKWLQRIMLQWNRYVTLPLTKKVNVELSPVELKKLQAIPKDAGNMMVGPHPDMVDGSVMFYLYNAVNQVPAGFFMASEAIQKKNKYMRTLLNSVGAVSIVRGDSNPKAIDYLTDKIAHGGWGGIFPEGAIYTSRSVMPMEYGAIRIAIESALKVQEEAKAQEIPENKMRPMFMTPFSHVYFHTNLKKMQKRMEKDLQEVEAMPEVFGKAQSGPFVERMRKVARQILESRANRYHIPMNELEGADLYAQADKLQNILLEQVEQKYFGEVHSGYSRRRAMKVRTLIYKELADPQITPERKAELKEDIQKTLDIIALVAFDRTYLNKFNDIEVWGEFLRRFRDSVGLSYEPFGQRKAVVKVLPLKDMHPLAKHYAALSTPEEKQQYLFKLTEELRQEIQEGVNRICAENPVPQIS